MKAMDKNIINATEAIDVLVDNEPVLELNQLFNQFFSKHNCRSLFTILNKFSGVDALINSGGTSVVVEYKNRNKSVVDYDSIILEYKKLHRIKVAGKSFDAPQWYVMEFEECVLVYDLTNRSEYEFNWVEQLQPESLLSTMKIEKKVCYLPYSMADFIISKHSWTRKSFDELNNFINKKRRQQYEN